MTALSFRHFNNVAELPCGPRLLTSTAVTCLRPRGLALLREALLSTQFCYGLISLSYLEFIQLPEFVGLRLPGLESFQPLFLQIHYPCDPFSSPSGTPTRPSGFRV